MIVNMRTTVATVNLAFYSSKNAALIERKMLHYTTLSRKLHHCTLSEIKTQVFTLSDVLACVSIHCMNQKQHSNRDFLTKSFDNTLQTCVDIANEYLHACNTGVKSHAFCRLHQCKSCINVKVIPCFWKHLYSLTKRFEIQINIFCSIRSKQSRQASQKVIDSSRSFCFYG